MTGWIIMLASALGAIAPVAAQQPTPDAPPAVAPDAVTTRLDALLAAKDYAGLGRALGQPTDGATFRIGLDWLRDRMRAGSTSFVPILYARILWNVTADMPEQARTGLRDMAVLATLYAYGAIEIDGQRCADRTAPAHRQQQSLAVPGLLDHYRAMSAERRAMALQGAVMTDRITAQVREAKGDVAFVCTGGLEETTYNLGHGTAREAPRKPGEVGRQILLSGDGRYRPAERPEAEWRPAMAKTRATLPNLLRLGLTPPATP